MQRTTLKWLAGALIACLTLSLSACVSTMPVMVDRPVPIKLPHSMTAATPAPAVPQVGSTNNDLDAYAAELRTALASANGDKARIRAYADGTVAALDGAAAPAVPGAAVAAAIAPGAKSQAQAPPGATPARPSLRDRIKNLWKGKKP